MVRFWDQRGARLASIPNGFKVLVKRLKNRKLPQTSQELVYVSFSKVTVDFVKQFKRQKFL